MDGESHAAVVRQPSPEERLEEVSIALTAAHEVNTHLNAEIERLTAELAVSRAEGTAYQTHIRDLSKKLAQTKQQRGEGGNSSRAVGKANGGAVDGATDVETADGTTTDGPDPSKKDASSHSSAVPGVLLSVDSSSWQEIISEASALGLLVAPDEVTMGAELGRGTFGTTHEGMWRGARVAVKRVRVTDADGALLLGRELVAAARARHPHVLALYGACLTDPADAWLLTELAPGGTMARWLHGAPGALRAPRRDRKERLALALDVARGLQALAESEPPILHRDIKPSNVFVFEGSGTGFPSRSSPPLKFHAKISDLGLARCLSSPDDACLTGETGTYLYMSPENMRHESYGTPGDVWSWGVLAVEALTQRPPYAGLHLAPVQVALAVAEGELRPTLPADCPPLLAQLLDSVFDPDPEVRPGFGLIVARLEAILERGLDGAAPQTAASQLQPLAQLVGSWGLNVRWPTRAMRS